MQIVESSGKSVVHTGDSSVGLINQRTDGSSCCDAYSRNDGNKKLTVIANFSGEEVRYPAWTMDTAGEPILCNYDSWPQEGVLRPWEAAMYLK